MFIFQSCALFKERSAARRPLWVGATTTLSDMPQKVPFPEATDPPVKALLNGWPRLAAAGPLKEVLAWVVFEVKTRKESLARGAAGGHKKLLGLGTAPPMA